MVYIFNEFNAHPMRFNLTVLAANNPYQVVDIYVRSDLRNTDLNMQEFRPCHELKEVLSILVRFGFAKERDQFLYFRDGKIIPALSSVGYGGLFTVTT